MSAFASSVSASSIIAQARALGRRQLRLLVRHRRAQLLVAVLVGFVIGAGFFAVSFGSPGHGHEHGQGPGGPLGQSQGFDGFGPRQQGAHE